jgi:pyruvyl transferase EpsO
VQIQSTTGADRGLISQLRDTAVEMLRTVIPRGRPLALLDFPRHANVGDSAIWLGEISGLAQSGVKRGDIRYMCDLVTYNEDALRRAIGSDGVILLHGGGNFGDIWDRHQLFRESIVAAFPDHHVIVLPQSIQFSDEGALHRAADVFNRHRELTILARDRCSLQLLQQHFSSESHLCPDMAFCLGPLTRAKADRDVVYLARTDKESKFDDVEVALPNSPGVSPCDWPEIGNAWQWRAGDTIAHFGADHPRAARLLDPPVTVAVRVTYHAMARERLNAGCRLLGQGRVVVADRLHAHILSLLMGIPHVVLDNSYGKIERFREAWTSGSRLTRVAHSRDEAFETAQAMLRNAD